MTGRRRTISPSATPGRPTSPNAADLPMVEDFAKTTQAEKAGRKLTQLTEGAREIITAEKC